VDKLNNRPPLEAFLERLLASLVKGRSERGTKLSSNHGTREAGKCGLDILFGKLQCFSHAVQSKKLPFWIGFGYHTLVKQWVHRRIPQKYTHVAQMVTWRPIGNRNPCKNESGRHAVNLGSQDCPKVDIGSQNTFKMVTNIVCCVCVWRSAVHAVDLCVWRSTVHALTCEVSREPQGIKIVYKRYPSSTMIPGIHKDRHRNADRLELQQFWVSEEVRVARSAPPNF